MSVLDFPQHYPRIWRNVSFALGVIGAIELIWNFFSSEPAGPGIAREIRKLGPTSGYIAVAVCGVMFVWWLLSYFHINHGNTKNSSEFISLTEATEKIYERARQSGNIWASIAENNAKKAQNNEQYESIILSTIASLITGRVNPYGYAPLSRVLERLDLRGAQYEFSNRASECRRIFGRKTLWKDLRITKHDFESLLNLVSQKTDLKDF